MLAQLDVTLEGSTPIDKKMIKKMVDYYRNNRRMDGNCLKFAHFPLTELIQLLVDNIIIDPLTPVQQAKIASYGLKMYMANHANDSATCPGGRSDYRNKDTVVICNTLLTPQTGGFSTWVDMLDANSWVGNSGAPASSAGMGLDKTTICPPDCPSSTNHDNMDISSIS